MALPPIHPKSKRRLDRPYPVSPACPFLANIVMTADLGPDISASGPDGLLTFAPMPLPAVVPTGVCPEVLAHAARCGFDDPDFSPCFHDMDFEVW